MLTCLKAEGEIVPSRAGVINGASPTRLRLHVDLRPGREPGHTVFICSAFLGGETGLDPDHCAALDVKRPELVKVFTQSLEAALVGNGDRHREGTLWRRLFSWVQNPGEGT